MNKVKYIAIRIFLLLVITAASSLIYKLIYWEPELKLQGPMLFNLKEFQWYNDVLYFGESSNIYVDPEDTDKRNISDLINDSLPGMRISGIQHSAYHAGMFLPVIEHIEPNARVKHIVVTMNLRSFGQPWIFSGLEGNLMRTKCFYKPGNPMLNRMKATLGFYDRPSQEEMDHKMLNAFKNDIIQAKSFNITYPSIDQWKDHVLYHKSDGSTDEAKQALAHHFIKAYGFSIDTNTNPRIKDFDQIVSVCKQKGLKIYFNLLSENTHYADSLVGKELYDLMLENKNLLIKRYESKGVIMIDNFQTVPAECFGEKNWTTEHYNQKGRILVAEKVRKAIMANR